MFMTAKKQKEYLCGCGSPYGACCYVTCPLEDMVILEIVEPACRASILAYFNGSAAWTERDARRYAVFRESAEEILAPTTEDGKPRDEWRWARIVPGDPAPYAGKCYDDERPIDG
jgi:hypothetical protein